MPEIVLTILLVIVSLAVAVVLARTFSFARPPAPVEPAEGVEVMTAAVAEHLSELIRCETVSVGGDHPPRGEAFLELHRALEKMYPRVHASLQRRVINDYSLLYTWPGTRPDLQPILLMAHQDVVPADPATLPEWEHAPFDGQVSDGYIWGRGALDVKNQLVAIMEAVESLLNAGFPPQRTVYLGFGHDEEIGGNQGARQISAWLQKQEIRLEAVLDEGGSLVKGLLPGIEVPVALVGNVEKGYLTLDLTVTGTPGHSSTPPPQTAIGVLAQALARLEANPMPAHVEMIQPLFQGVGTAAPFVNRMAIANLWLFGGIVRRMLEAKQETNATIRTTTAVTVISGGVKDNILPREAKASVNFRLLPGDRIEDVITHVRRVIDDERVQIRQKEGFGSGSSPLSPTDTPAYQNLACTIRQVFGDVAVAPYLVLGATDARHYAPICDHVYRFSPVLMMPEDLDRVHGINERIGVEDMAQMVKFFGQLIQVWGSETL